MPSPAIDDYLKTIYHHTEWQDDRITPSRLALELGLAPSSVTEMVQKLAAQGLVTHRPYGPIVLTPEGERRAGAIIRRHRLVETWLVREFGYGWDEVHDEAEVLEHAVSDLFVERIAAQLGHPRRDPHGDPIPGADGTFEAPAALVLWDVEPGDWAVARISDADPGLLRYLESVDLVLDAAVTVVERRTVAGVISVRVGGRTVDLGEVAARAIWLVPAA